MKFRFVIALILMIFSYASAVPAEPLQLQGKIVNGTHQASGSAEMVTLLSLAQGMEELASLKNVNGTFQFPIVKDQPGPLMLRVTYQGVNYFKTIGPFQAKQQETHEIIVYDSVASLDKAIIKLPHLFIKRADNQLIFNWSFEVENPTNTTMNKLGGLFQVHIPQGAESLNISASSNGKMPLRASLSKDQEENFRINYAVKPGKTAFEVAYAMDYSKENFTLETKALYSLQKVMAIFYPEDLRVESPGLKEIQVDKANRVRIAGWDSIAAGQIWRISIAGGSKIAEPVGDATAMHNHGEGEQEDHQVVEKPPAIAKVMWVILVLMALGLGLNMGLFLWKSS